MADYTQTITNRLGVYSGDTTSRWGTMVWGVDNWGWDNDLITQVDKVLANTATPTTSLSFDVDKIIAETTTPSDSWSKDYTLAAIANSLGVSSAQNPIYLQDSAGFYHIFRGNTTEGEDQINSTYTEGSTDDSGWTEGSEPSTSWS